MRVASTKRKGGIGATCSPCFACFVLGWGIACTTSNSHISMILLTWWINSSVH